MMVDEDKILFAAMMAHEANRAYCATLGDLSQKAWPNAPDWQRDSEIKGVRLIAENPNTSPRESHESWMAEKRATGWTYGLVKNAETKQHPCFVPYEQLPESQRIKDVIFGAVVRAALVVKQC